MLRLHSHHIAPSLAKGFSLIEMMISITIGMIVAAGAVMLIVAIDRSNSETIQTTRINQELRALSSVIADEVKRARHLHDPVAAVGQGATSNGTFDFVDTSQFNTSHSTATPKWSDCIIYGYQDTPQISDTTVNEVAVDNYEAIYRKVTNGVGSVVFARSTDPANKADCTTDGTQLTSDQLNVTDVQFSCVTISAGNVVDDILNSASCNQINISITAKLLSGDTLTKTIPHTYVQQVFIRSGAVKTT